MQHWWLPQTGRGVRTRVSDDRVWLCYCVAHYIEVTADEAILDEIIAVPAWTGVARRRVRQFFPADHRGGVGDTFRTLRARNRGQPCRRVAWFAPDRFRRLERRDEQCRRRRAAARASGSGGSCILRYHNSRRSRRRVASLRVQPRGVLMLLPCALPLSRTAGMATGIGAPISTMAHRSDRQQTKSAGLIQLRSRGA